MEDTDQLLARLSQKAGVQSTLVLARDTGAIVQEVARMVWTFIGAAAGLATGLDEHDELKLLRLRTKKVELVIVPANGTAALALDEPDNSDEDSEGQGEDDVDYHHDLGQPVDAATHAAEHLTAVDTCQQPGGRSA
ncbi:MAG: hypothetical protein M1826_005981 [Phylliscum demangeonii]|nr:MAG: hypothetical protein M1826_005981 [Phylliscum demangeonii]